MTDLQLIHSLIDRNEELLDINLDMYNQLNDLRDSVQLRENPLGDQALTTYQPVHPWGPHSIKVLYTLRPELVHLSNGLADVFNCTAFSGYRGEQEQKKLHAKGVGLPWPLSKHNKKPSDAVDIIPYPITDDWSKHIDQFDMMIGAAYVIARQGGYKIKSGKYFTNRADYPHFEIVE